MSKNKSESQVVHALRRAAERYGLELNESTYRELVNRIRKPGRKGNKPAILVERQSLRVSVWDIDLDGKMVRVVYDRTRKNIVTFLPRTGLMTYMNGGST
jgi:hypothetical protein